MSKSSANFLVHRLMRQHLKCKKFRNKEVTNRLEFLCTGYAFTRFNHSVYQSFKESLFQSDSNEKIVFKKASDFQLTKSLFS